MNTVRATVRMKLLLKGITSAAAASESEGAHAHNEYYIRGTGRAHIERRTALIRRFRAPPSL